MDTKLPAHFGLTGTVRLWLLLSSNFFLATFKPMERRICMLQGEWLKDSKFSVLFYPDDKSTDSAIIEFLSTVNRVNRERTRRERGKGSGQIYPEFWT